MKFYTHARVHWPSADVVVSFVASSDQVDPLRVTEILIVICVLTLWFISIFVFIRHSQLLRIRHRDIPYRSTSKPSVNVNHISPSTRHSDLPPQRKSFRSSTGGLTPPVDRHVPSEPRHVETVETISLTVSPSARKHRPVSLLNRGFSLTARHPSDKHDDKQQLLDPRQISAEVKESLLELHRKSMENLATMKCTTFYSVHDMRGQQRDDSQQSSIKARRIKESPV